MIHYSHKIFSVHQTDQSFAISIALPATPSPRPSIPSIPSIKVASMWHASRDLAGQALGRTAGLGVLVALSQLEASKLPIQIIAGGMGAIAAGTQAYLIGKNQIGSTTTLQKTALAFCTFTAAAAGGSVAALGSMQPVVVLASCAIATGTASLLNLLQYKNPEERIVTEKAKAIAFSLATAASLSGVLIANQRWRAAEPTLVARSMASFTEATLIELCKTSLEKLGPSVDRSVLNFEGKVGVSLLGLLPYYVATVVFNGILSAKLQPTNDSHEFLDLWGPLTVGALANAVRGAANAAAVYLQHQNKANVKKAHTSVLRPHSGIQPPDLLKMAQKTAVRFLLSTCRNAIYFSLRENGMSMLSAACMAQAFYSLFAQNRDLIYDLMQGEGWSEPVLIARQEIDNVSVSTTISEDDSETVSVSSEKH